MLITLSILNYFYKDISNLEVLSAKGLDFIKMKFDALKNRHSLTNRNKQISKETNCHSKI